MPAFSRLAAAGFATALSFHAAAGTVGLGQVLTTKDGGQIFGFAIDQHGNDGVLASAQTVDGNGDVLVSVEIFDQRTGKITKSLAKHRGPRHEYAVDGIFAGDVALVTHDVTPKGSIYARRVYAVMNPVGGGRFTGDWTPPVKDIEVLQAGADQDGATAALFAIELKKDDRSRSSRVRRRGRDLRQPHPSRPEPVRSRQRPAACAIHRGEQGGVRAVARCRHRRRTSAAEHRDRSCDRGDASVQRLQSRPVPRRLGQTASPSIRTPASPRRRPN